MANFIDYQARRITHENKMKCIIGYMMTVLWFTSSMAMAGDGSCDCKRFNLPETGDAVGQDFIGIGCGNVSE
jgi:hypothetical protein